MNEYRLVYVLASDKKIGAGTAVAWASKGTYRVRPARNRNEICGFLVGAVRKAKKYRKDEKKRYVFIQTRGECTLPE